MQEGLYLMTNTEAERDPRNTLIPKELLSQVSPVLIMLPGVAHKVPARSVFL